MPLLSLKYLDKEGRAFSQFLDLVPVVNGKADTVVTADKNVILKKGFPTEISMDSGLMGQPL